MEYTLSFGVPCFSVVDREIAFAHRSRMASSTSVSSGTNVQLSSLEDYEYAKPGEVQQRSEYRLCVQLDIASTNKITFLPKVRRSVKIKTERGRIFSMLVNLTGMCFYRENDGNQLDDKEIEQRLLTGIMGRRLEDNRLEILQMTVLKEVSIAKISGENILNTLQICTWSRSYRNVEYVFRKLGIHYNRRNLGRSGVRIFLMEDRGRVDRYLREETGQILTISVSSERKEEVRLYHFRDMDTTCVDKVQRSCGFVTDFLEHGMAVPIYSFLCLEKLFQSRRKDCHLVLSGIFLWFYITHITSLLLVKA